MEKKRKNTITRRDFIKKSAIAAGALYGTSLGVLPKRVWADKKNNSVIVGMTQEPAKLNPILYDNSGTEEVPESCMFDALWDILPNGEFTPNLAVKIPTFDNGGISSDGLTWKIELKKGVRWQDGKPFTAADVEYTYQEIMNPKNAVRFRTGFDRIEEFRIQDDYNVELELKAPFVPLHWSWEEMHIMPKHVLSKYPDISKAPWNNEGTFGTGPYKLVKRVSGSHMVYKANPDYHRGEPKIKTFIHKFVPEQQILYMQLKTGEIDVMGIAGIPKERFQEAQALPNVDILQTPQPWVEFLMFNCSKPYFTDKRVRQALYLALDKEKIIKDVHYATAPRTLSYLNPIHWAYNKNLKDPGFDLRKAAEMLDGAGWKVGSDGIRQKDGVKMAFSISTTSGDTQREQAEAILQQDYKKIGVAVEIKNFVAPVMWGTYFSESKFDMIFIGVDPTLAGDPDYSGRMHSRTNWFHKWPGDPELDKLFDEGTQVKDLNKRKAIYDRVQEIMLDACVMAPIFSTTGIYAKKKNLRGYEINPYTTDICMFIQDWYWM